MIVSLVIYEAKNKINQITENLVRTLVDSMKIQEIVVVDHSPKSHFSEFNFSEKINFIHNKENPGFGIGHNNAIKNVKNKNWKLWLCLNPDIVINNEQLDSIKKEIEYLTLKGLKGCYQPIIRNSDNSLQLSARDRPSIFNMLRRMIYRLIDYPIPVNKYNILDDYYSYECLSGCFLIIPKEVLIEIGGFDERYFMYLEDLDLTLRIGSRFHNIQLHTSVEHVGKYESRRSKKLLMIHIQSYIKFLVKWNILRRIKGVKELNTHHHN